MLCCYLIRILGLEGLMTTNTQTINSGMVPKYELSTLRSDSKILTELIFNKS